MVEDKERIIVWGFILYEMHYGEKACTKMWLLIIDKITSSHAVFKNYFAKYSSLACE
jgi:hypothetical protein